MRQNVECVNGYYIVQLGQEFYTALRLCCKDDDGRDLNHLLIISGPFNSYELADKKRNGNLTDKFRHFLIRNPYPNHATDTRRGDYSTVQTNSGPNEKCATCGVEIKSRVVRYRFNVPVCETCIGK